MTIIIESIATGNTKEIHGVQLIEEYWTTENNGTNFIKACTEKETHKINLKENKVTIWQ